MYMQLGLFHAVFYLDVITMYIHRWVLARFYLNFTSRYFASYCVCVVCSIEYAIEEETVVDLVLEVSCSAEERVGL